MAQAKIEVFFGADLRAWERGLRKLENQTRRVVRNMERSADRIGRKWEDVGKRLTIGITAPLAGVTAAAARTAASFDDELNKVVSLVGVSREQVNAWREDLLRLAPALGKSPEELAQGLFFITSAGARGATAMQTLVATAKASAAGMGELRDIANAVTSAMAVYGVETLNAGDATGILLATVREGKFEPSELADSLGKVLSVGKNVGITFNDMSAAIAAMTKVNGDARKSITAMRGLMKPFVKETPQVTEQFRIAGTSFDEMRQKIKDEGLLPALIELRRELEANGGQASKLFEDMDGLTGLLDLTGENVEAVSQVFKNLANSDVKDLNKAFEEAQTASFKFRQAQAAINVAMIRFGSAVLPSVIPFVEDMVVVTTKLAEKFDNLSDGMKKTIIRWGALAAIVGPFLVILGATVRSLGFLIGSLGLVATALGGVGKVLMWLGRTIKATLVFVGTFVAGIGAIPTAFIAAVAASLAILKVFGTTLGVAASDLAAKFGFEFMKAWRNKFEVPFLNALKALDKKVGFIDLGIEVPEKITDDFVFSFGDIFARARENAVIEINIMKMQLQKLLGNFDDLAPNLDGLQDFFEDEGINFEAFAAGLKSMEAALADLNEAASKAGNSTKDKIDEVKTAVEGVANAFEADLTNALVRGELNFRSFADTVLREFLRLQVVKPLMGFIGLGGEGGFLSDLFGSIFGLGKAGGGRIQPGVPTLVGERGPEIVIPSVPGTVRNANDTRSAMGSGPVSVVVNNHFDVGLESVEARINQKTPVIAAAVTDAVIDAQLRRPRHF